MKKINVNKLLFLLTSITPIPVFCLVFYYLMTGPMQINLLPFDKSEYPKWIVSVIDIILISIAYIVLIVFPMLFTGFFSILHNWVFYGMASKIRNEIVESEVNITKSYDDSKGYCYDINSQYKIICIFADNSYFITPNWGDTKENIKFYKHNSFNEINNFAIEKFKHFIY